MAPPKLCSFILKTCLTILWGEMALALSNYTLPFGVGSPFLPPGAFGPPPQIGAQSVASSFVSTPSRTPYTPPTYLPPDNYNRDQDRGFEQRQGSYYNNFNKDPRQPERSGSDFYGRKTEQTNTNTQQRKGSDYRGYENQEQGYPGRPSGFTRVQGGTTSGQSRAQLHAVLDYDEDYYEDASEGQTGGNGGNRQAATPIQGPIFLKNGSVPVVPLYSYPVLSNGTFIQIPILWSALSVALGLEVRGQLIRGVPCIKRFHQLFCPTAGNTYPIERIESFIDENKALMKRMYGDFTIYTEYGLPPETAAGGRGRRRAPGASDPFAESDSPDGHKRQKRQTNDFGNRGTSSRPQPPGNPPFSNQGNSTGRIDACESKMEIVTPYWALNSAGKVRAVVNTMHFEQAIHQEVCSKTQTSRCAGDCGCEQKYKWHRLLAYDPDQDCAGIFMDWFLFPSCCVCRCVP